MLYAEVSIASKHLECQMFQRMSSQIFVSLDPPPELLLELFPVPRGE